MGVCITVCGMCDDGEGARKLSILVWSDAVCWCSDMCWIVAWWSVGWVCGRCEGVCGVRCEGVGVTGS